MKRLYSARLPWETPPNRLWLLRSQRPPRLDLTISNPTQAGFEYPDSEILAALADPRALRYDPAPLGLDSAREAIARYSGSARPAQVLLTASTSEAYAMLFKLFCDPADEVLIPAPSYPLFEFLAGLEAVRARQYPLLFDGSGWSVGAIEVGERTRAAVAVSPNNPTGSVLQMGDAASLRNTGLPVILDEVFCDYTRDHTRKREPVDLDFAWRLNGLSKAAALPQLKLGWIICPGDVPPALELIADTYLSVSAPVQFAAGMLLDVTESVRRQIRARTERNLVAAANALRGSPLTPLPVDGGWTLPIQLPRLRTEEEWAMALIEQESVWLQPGFFYDFPDEAFLVASSLTPPDVFDEGLWRLRQLVERVCDSRQVT